MISKKRSQNSWIKVFATSPPRKTKNVFKCSMNFSSIWFLKIGKRRSPSRFPAKWPLNGLQMKLTGSKESSIRPPSSKSTTNSTIWRRSSTTLTSWLSRSTRDSRSSALNELISKNRRRSMMSWNHCMTCGVLLTHLEFWSLNGLRIHLIDLILKSWRTRLRSGELSSNAF